MSPIVTPPKQSMVFNTIVINDRTFYVVRPMYNYTEMGLWCKEIFGDPVITLGDYLLDRAWFEFMSSFYFAHDTDRTLFVLRWT